jgi:hypothetical protein
MLMRLSVQVKGKVMFDAIVAKPRLANQYKDTEYWIDVADYDADALYKHLKVGFLND